jgi:hypothetical protein
VFQVVVLPPDGAATRLEEFRRVHDPAFHRIGAHLALLPPFEADDRALAERFADFRASAFDVSFGPAAPIGRALGYPVEDGADAVRALTASLASALLGPFGEPPFLVPAVRVGLFGSDAEMELARRTLWDAPPPGPWRVAEVTLLLEDVRGLWHPVRRAALQ